jgi:cation/acetate symporter
VPEAVHDLGLVLCLMAGTASLPHILLRPAATPRTDQARKAAAWTLLFIALLVLTLPTFFTLAADEAGRDRSGVLQGLVLVIGLTAMLAAASSVTLTLANSLGHDLFALGAGLATRLVLRVLLIAVIALAAYGAMSLPPEPLDMAAWSFSLAAAGYFPALVLGIWWPRTTAMAAVCGMTAGFGLALFYIVTSRYFPQAGVAHFGMSSLLDPANGQLLVNVAQALADPRWLADVPASADNPLASKVGWLNVGNLACGIFGMPVGFLTIIALSLIGKRSPLERQAAVDALRTPAHARTQEPTGR